MRANGFMPMRADHLEASDDVYRCDGCGAQHPVPRCCGNRHCPTCQQHKVHQWLGRGLDRLLPCEYFLVTFTVRPELRRLVLSGTLVKRRAAAKRVGSRLAKQYPRDEPARRGSTGLLEWWIAIVAPS